MTNFTTEALGCHDNNETLIDVTSAISCPFCHSKEVTKKGWYYYSNGRKQQKFFCKGCSKFFKKQSLQRKAESAEIDCPKCNSNNTVKQGKSIQRSFGKVQICRCRDCGRRFTQGQKKMFNLYIEKKLVGRFPVTLRNNYFPNVVCPNCAEYKSYLYGEFIDRSLKNPQRKHFVCFGCGHQFKGEEF